MRYYLIDRIDKVQYGKHIEGVKCIALADDVFNEHFPGYPIFPGSLIIEGMAQLGGALIEMTFKREGKNNKRCLLSIVNKIKLRNIACPGDTLDMSASIVSLNDEYAVAKVKAMIRESLCADGEITFSFVEIEDEKLTRNRTELYALLTTNAVFME